MSLLNVILEGKKENLIDKYKNSINLEDSNQLIEKLIDLDPSATKKYSEWAIKELIRLWNSPGNNFNSIVDLINFMGDEIKTYHELSNSITDKDVEYFLKQIDSANSWGIKYFESQSNQDRLRRSPKDIYSYPSIWVVQLMNNSINERKKIQKEEEEVKKDVEKIYEDSRFLVVRPFSHKASCFYGANTKWCTTTKSDDYHFRRYTKNGSLYYIIDKEAVGHASLGKMALHVSNDGNATAWDQQDNNRGIDFMLERFAPISDTLKKLVRGDDDYELLKKASEGNKGALNSKLSAEYFDRFEDGYAYFEFDDLSDYLSLLSNEIEEYELKDIEYAIETPYGYDSYYYDSYNFDDDMKEGYPLRALKPNHLILLKDILTIANSDLVKCFTSRPSFNRNDLKKFIEKGNDKIDYYDLYRLELKDECNSEIGRFLLDFDQRFTDDFRYAYSTAEDESMKEGVKKEMTDELCSIYDQIGIEKVPDGKCFDEYRISIDKLLEYYEENLENFSGLTIDQMFKDVLVPNLVNYNVREPRELAYEVRDDETFNHHFDDDVTSALESLKERIEDSDNYSDLDEYKSIYTFISNKYGFDRDIEIPTVGDNVTIKFYKVDPSDNRIEFTITRRGDNYGFKKGRAKLSTIQQLMSNYQLFDPLED